MSYINYYDILTINYTSSPDEIKSAYRRLAKTQHPDVGGSVEKMKLINEAYEILSNPKKKLQYDNLLFNAEIEKNTTSEQFQPKKQTKSTPTHNERTNDSSNPKFHRTKAEKHMSTEFLLQYAAKIKEFEDNIYCSKAYDKTQSITERIRACDKSIQSFYDFKNFCYSYDGGVIYFQDHWEYCHNSHNECFSFVENLKKQKEKLQKQNEKYNRKAKKMYF